MTTAVAVPLLTPDPAAGAIVVLVENPAEQSPVVSNDVWRRPVGGVGERLAVGVARNGEWTDKTPGFSPNDYQYQVVAHGTDGTISTSPWAGIRVARYNVTRLGAAVFG